MNRASTSSEPDANPLSATITFKTQHGFSIKNADSIDRLDTPIIREATSRVSSSELRRFFHNETIEIGRVTKLRNSWELLNEHNILQDLQKARNSGYVNQHSPQQLGEPINNATEPLNLDKTKKDAQLIENRISNLTSQATSSKLVQLDAPSKGKSPVIFPDNDSSPESSESLSDEESSEESSESN